MLFNIDRAGLSDVTVPPVPQAINYYDYKKMKSKTNDSRRMQ